MPQLDFSTFPSQIFWLIITFGLLYLILAKNFLPRIGSVLEQRRDTVDHDLMKAQQLREEAQQALEEYEEALVQARSDAQRLAQEVRDEIAKIAAEQEAQAMEKISSRCPMTMARPTSSSRQR
jgi:F-type H+-transporting ATPase subunit b